MKTDYLALTWATSRGHETYGYNIARLDADSTGQRFKCMGGGYDMVGTVVADWLQDTYQDRLIALASANPERVSVRDDSGITAPDHGACRLYGFTFMANTGRALLDGGCGLDSMLEIAKAIGISVLRTGNKKGQTTGFMVTDYGSADAMRAAGF